MLESFNYLTFEETKLSAKPQKRYSEAQSGSLGIENINEIIWTAKIASKLREVRNTIEGMKHGNIVDGGGSAQVGTIQKEKTETAIRYFDLLCKDIENSIRNKEYSLAKAEANRISIAKDSKRLKTIQNELELLFAIEKSQDPVEMVFDLWKAAVAKGQTSRKAEFNALVKSLQESKKMKKEDAEKEAEKLLMAKVPSVVKVPSSFHLKLY